LCEPNRYEKPVDWLTGICWKLIESLATDCIPKCCSRYYPGWGTMLPLTEPADFK